MTVAHLLDNFLIRPLTGRYAASLHVRRHRGCAGAVSARPGGVASVADERHPPTGPPIQVDLVGRVEVEVRRLPHLNWSH
jgi:hypothetical protein